MEDKRPDPKPRKHAYLWQAYLFWNEMVELRKRHNLRISSCEKGKSNLDAQIEIDFLNLVNADSVIDFAEKTMIAYGQQCGPIWEWLVSIRGLGSGSLAAQLLAQIDDIAKFATISKLWRHAGMAVINGKAERTPKGETSAYNRRLKSLLVGKYGVAYQFVNHHSYPYRDIYDEEKLRLRRLHPEKYLNERGKMMYNDGHIDNMARRKIAKIFLQHVWLMWRKFEGLPISQPYVRDILGHTHIVYPEGYERLFIT